MNNKHTPNSATAMASRPERWPQQLIVVLCLLWSLTAFAVDSGEYLRDARAYFDKGEFNAAVIQLKNALLTDPANKEARLLLGKAYLKQKDGLSAEKELRRAQELGATREAVLVPLGRTLLMTGQNDKLLQAVTPEAGDSDALKVDILLLQGQAYLTTGKLALADEKFSKALELKPATVEALLGKARIAYQNQDKAGSAELVEQALSSEPDNANAWAMKGELLRNANKPQEAVTAFAKAIDVEPGNTPARLGRAMVLLSLGKPDQANADIDWLLEKYPGLYLAHFLKAQALYQQGQPEPAQESVQRALKQAPGHLPSHLLAGTIAYHQEQLNQAEQHLRTYWNSAPWNRTVARLLAATLLKLKQPDKAIEVLEPGASSAVDDPQYLSLLGSAYLRNGDTSRGVEYLEQAAAIAPDVAGIRTQLAIGQLAQGNIEQGISELQSAVDLDEGPVDAEVLLVMTYLQRKDFDQALAASEILAEKMPDSPLPLNLKGGALLGNDNPAAAKQAFEAALKLQPEFLPAHLNLAQLDLMNGDTAAAEARYRKVLSYDEGNLKALLGLAALAKSDGQVEKTAQWLKQAHELHPEAIQPALLLVQHYRQLDETDRALDLAEAVAMDHPRKPTVLMALAQSQLDTGNDKDALATLRKLVEAAPRSPAAHYLLAAVQVDQKETEAARVNLQQALQLQADYPAAQLLLGRLYIADKDYTAALGIAANLLKAHPEAAYGDELKGDVYASRKAYQQAADAYARAYHKSGSALLAQKLSQSRLQTGETEAAHEALRQWLADHPEDVPTRGMLAQILLRANQRSEAIEEYRKLLEYEPDKVLALNNLAWLYQEENNPEGIKYAERAYQLVPDRPEVIDTLGWLLVQNGETNRGLVLLQEAATKAPHLPDIRYHMAAALEKAGRHEEARKELDRLLKANKTFDERDKAEALRDQLGG
jgi:putative PEP-CTERM system TPR-repeat lipoprotein